MTAKAEPTPNDSRAVYLDHHATTPCDPRVVNAMLPFFTSAFGNASSSHAWGRAASDHVEKARAAVAKLLGCEPSEIVFTSGATEADNLALLGVMEHASRRGRHVITQQTEHKAVLDTCAELERRGFEVTYLTVDADGRVKSDQLADAIRHDTALVSIMWANNEIGVVQPIPEISDICRAEGVLLHTDAAQALTYLDCDVQAAGVDLMSISGHKIYGPKGIGALYVRKTRPRARLQAQMHGGGHERGRRSGTLDVPSIVGLGVACDLIAERRENDSARALELRRRLQQRLATAFPDLRVNGCLTHRLPNNLNVSLPGIDSRDLIEQLEDVAISSGSACSSAGQDGSYVLAALPGAKDLADNSLRFGIGRSTTEADIDLAVSRIQAAARIAARMPARSQECGVPA